MKKKTETIFLNDSYFLGEGTNRKCYIHPLNPNVCIKISSIRGQRSAQREISYFKRLHKRGKSFEMISDYRGKVQTNLGEGNLFEMVRDFDGTVSKNLEYYFGLNNETMVKQMLYLVEQLRLYLHKEYILISDLDMDNILVKKLSDNKYQLVMIDGLGDNNQIPFLEFIKPLGLKRSARKWEVFKRKIADLFPNISKQIAPFFG